jgi:hypothetical protein
VNAIYSSVHLEVSWNWISGTEDHTSSQVAATKAVVHELELHRLAAAEHQQEELLAAAKHQQLMAAARQQQEELLGLVGSQHMEMLRLICRMFVYAHPSCGNEPLSDARIDEYLVRFQKL